MTQELCPNQGVPPPAAGEVAELVAALRDPCIAPLPRERTRAAELLERQQPQPVSVSERPWEREGWRDEQGRCWCFTPRQDFDGHLTFHSRWILSIPDANVDTHCLPAHALPLPTP